MWSGKLDSVKGATSRAGAATAALAAIVVITVGWWALALYPAGSTPPEWLLRTRLACFGSSPNGLPNAGGWVLLIGEPVGMAVVLLAVWGRELRSELRGLLSHRVGRLVLMNAALGVIWAAGAASRVIWQATQRRIVTDSFATATAHSMEVWPAVPSIDLIDQHGRPFELRAHAGQPLLITFAFGHCESVCPTVVHELLEVRDVANRRDVPLVIVTVDPWRDVPARLASIAAEWGLKANDYLVSGDTLQVNRTLDAWGVGRSRDAGTGEVSHAVLAVLVDSAQRSATRVTGDIMQLASQLRPQ
ncbi:MAG: SCO family protein [Gemmatimonadaceae bacterium]